MLFSIFGLDFKIEEWGFTLDKKAFISIALGFLFLLIVYFRSKVVIPPKLSWDFILAIFGSSAEELCFRVLAISALLVIFQNSRYKGWWAVLGSSILFTIPHLHGGKPLNFVITGILPSALILGFIFYRTRSNFFPIMIHIVSNTAGEAGILGGLIFAFFYFVLVIGKKILTNIKTGKGLSLNNP